MRINSFHNFKKDEKSCIYMNPSEIINLRLHNQQLEHSRSKKPSEVVEWFGALQAQDYAGAKWSVGIRLPGSADKTIEKAIKDKLIVRTWLMRGTLHFVTALDIQWMLELLGPRIIAKNARRYRELGLDENTLFRSNMVLKNALKDNKYLKRTELRAILEKEGISTEGQRAAYMLQRASLDGIICQSFMHRNNPIYMSIDELTKTKSLSRDKALEELANRYFTSHGPATLQDFVWWSGLLSADAKAGLEAVKSHFCHESIDGKIYWWSKSISTLKHSSTKAHLLPGFDEYFVGYKNRSASLDTLYPKNLDLKNRFSYTIIVNGRVIGTWRRTFKKNTVIIEPKLFMPLEGAQKSALITAAESYGDFMDMPIYLK